jgi:methionyl-tRNA synthetase
MNDHAHPDPKHASIADFEKLELRVGTIKAVKLHPKNDDYILLIDLGIAEQDLQIVAAIKDTYTEDKLIGKQVCVVVNTKEEEILGTESQGLLLTTTKEGQTVLLQPDRAVHPGVKVYGVMDGKKTHHSEIGK